MNLKKSAIFTDLHLGKKANSKVHNQDCIDFVEWFCDMVRSDDTIDHIMFLGDWNENRSALNIRTLNYSYRAAKLLDDLGLPIYFCVGNHDLYHRHTRDLNSVIPFEQFKNFHIINEPTVIPEIGKGGAMMSPYLFHEEYPKLAEYSNIPFWAGHFEFRGFVMTGYTFTMPTGPDHADFKEPNIILSGHFHKRQAQDNVAFIGNAFPMDYGDAGDFGRGMATYDHEAEELLMFDWADCPKYIKTNLSELMDKSVTLHPNSRVKCVVDVPISFEESSVLKQSFTEEFSLREFTLEESSELKEALTNTEMVDLDVDTDNMGVDDLVIHMLNEIDSQHIKNEMLVDIYHNLKV